MSKLLSKHQAPVIRHDVIMVVKNNEQLVVRIMLVKYEGMIEVYYQEEGYPYEFAYGVADFEGFTRTLRDAQINVYRWGLHYE